MQDITIILFGLVMLIYASAWSADKTKSSRFQHLQGWQKLFGVLALVMTLLIVLNPEFLALGLLGDSALFDMLVLALSLQTRVFAIRAFHRFVDLVPKAVRWLLIPSPGLRYLMAFVTPVIAGAITTFQKALHRILS